MDILLQDILNEIGYSLPGFQRGFIIGVAVIVLALLILRLIINLINPKRRRCHGIDSAGEDGTLFISSTAISNLIDELQCEFDGIKFSKSILYKRKSKYYIKLFAELKSKDVDFQELVTQIRIRIFDSMAKNLGVSCIAKIDILLRKVNSTK